MSRRLSVRLHGLPVGTLVQDTHGRLAFAYEPSHLAAADARALSLSLPLGPGPFDDAAARAFFGGYLPESREARQALGRIFHASPNNDFALLAAIGRDCAGAVSLHPEDDPVVPDEVRPGALEPIDDPSLARMLRDLPRRPLFAGQHGMRLSLAGAQDKAAIYVRNDAVFLPHDGYPSTHILKPVLPHLADSVFNEALCLGAARRLGLDAVEARPRRIEDLIVLLVTRYDRALREDGRPARLPQEDLCQALGVPSETKYEAEGGPSLADAFAIMGSMAAPARDRLALRDAVLFDYLLGNPDAHGKNFSILRAPEGLRLAPLYDRMCGSVYAEGSGDVDQRMAMKIGGTYEPLHVMAYHWKRFADEVGLGFPNLRARLLDLATRLPEAVRATGADLGRAGFSSPLLDPIAQAVLSRAHHVQGVFAIDPTGTGGR